MATLQSPVPPPWGPPAAGAAGEQITEERISVTYELREPRGCLLCCNTNAKCQDDFFWGRREKILKVVLGEQHV